MTDTPIIRTVLADDHDLVRAGLRLLLERVPGLTVVTEARDGEELLASVREQHPDLVVTDISMRGTDGLTALATLRTYADPPRVIVASVHDSPDFIRRAYKLGASAYVMKEAPSSELAEAVAQVMAGHTYYSPQISQKLLLSTERSPEELLTDRQRQILLLIGRGFAAKEIGFRLGLSSKTVDVHRARIMERLGIDDLVGLAMYCVRHGLVDPSRDDRTDEAI